VVTVDDRDAKEVVGQDPRCDQAGHTRAHDHRVVTHLAMGVRCGHATVAAPGHLPPLILAILAVLERHHDAMPPWGTAPRSYGGRQHQAGATVATP
jgi:hypothetical protein